MGAARYYEYGPFASIAFHPIENGKWRSPARGTFAGFECEPSIGLDVLSDFYDQVEKDLIQQGAKTLEILLPPEAYDPSFHTLVVYLLRTKGFSISRCDMNYTMPVTTTPMQDHIRETQRQRLTKCQRDGMTAEQMPFSALKDIYAVIETNGLEKGFNLSMTASQIDAMEQAIPDSIILFAVQDKSKLASAAICVRTRTDALYIFMVGDAPGYQAHSPVVMMLDAIYAWCQKHRITLLDYGTSTNGTEPNIGLMDFKRRLGFSECLKLRMEKTL